MIINAKIDCPRFGATVTVEWELRWGEVYPNETEVREVIFNTGGRVIEYDAEGGKLKFAIAANALFKTLGWVFSTMAAGQHLQLTINGNFVVSDIL